MIQGDTFHEELRKRHAQFKDRNLQIPFASLWSIAEVYADYDLFNLPDIENARVLDIGANIGAFALHAVQRWYGAEVRAYEPHPVTYDLLKQNVAGLQIETHMLAITHGLPPGDVDLHEGKDNRLCCSIHNLGSQEDDKIVQVPTMDASELPACDVIKIDTEGCELQILQGYQHLGSVKILLAELHRDIDIDPFCAMAGNAGLLMLSRNGNTWRFCR